jgi:hypothetical protein
MPRRKGVRIALIVEDQRLEQFSRNVLYKCGFRRHEIRLAPYPVGRGSAKAWVESQYVAEVRIFRSKRYQRLGILVGTEADEQTVLERHESLARALREDSLAPRDPGERICLWVPKWNIETWILYFAGESCDEASNQKLRVRKPDFKTTATRFIDEYCKSRDRDDVETLSSLELAYGETERSAILD